STDLILLAIILLSYTFYYFFFFTAAPTTQIYALSLHDALPISENSWRFLDRSSESNRSNKASSLLVMVPLRYFPIKREEALLERDRKSTRLNSSHVKISYAVFCLKKKKTIVIHTLLLRIYT